MDTPAGAESAGVPPGVWDPLPPDEAKTPGGPQQAVVPEEAHWPMSKCVLVVMVHSCGLRCPSLRNPLPD